MPILREQLLKKEATKITLSKETTTGHQAHDRLRDENIWLAQKMMAALYGVSASAITQHLKRILAALRSRLQDFANRAKYGYP